MAKINIKEYLDKKYDKLNIATSTLSEKPKLVTFLIGDRKDSETYVRNKEKSIERAGMQSETIRIPDGTPIMDIYNQVSDANANNNVHGILIQLPLNKDYYTKADEDLLINCIKPFKDVDGLSMLNQARLFIGEKQNEFLTPCTPTGIVKLLKEISHENTLQGRDILVIGRSQLLGNSLAQMLMREDANVTLFHSKSGWELKQYLKESVIGTICLCAGSSNLLTANDLQDNSYIHTIIDAAINIGEDGKLRGDFKKEDYDKLDQMNIDYTSVPGGVGPLTTYTLAYNLYKAYCLQKDIAIQEI